MDYNEKDKLQLVEDKLTLQNTISTLTDEIELLSVKNEEFLSSLKNKDFYNEYQSCCEELRNLKEAHALLINMIKDEEIQINTTAMLKGSKNKDYNESKDSSFIVDLLHNSYNNPHNISNIHPNRAKLGPLQEIDINTGRNSTTLSSIFSCNGFNNMGSNGKITENEIDLKSNRNVKNNVEFLLKKLENVDVNFTKRNSP